MHALPVHVPHLRARGAHLLLPLLLQQLLPLLQLWPRQAGRHAACLHTLACASCWAAGRGAPSRGVRDVRLPEAGLASSGGQVVGPQSLVEDLLRLLVDLCIVGVPEAFQHGDVVLGRALVSAVRVPRVEELRLVAWPPERGVEEAHGEGPLLLDAHEDEGLAEPLLGQHQLLRRGRVRAAAGAPPVRAEGAQVVLLWHNVAVAAARQHPHEAALHRVGELQDVRWRVAQLVHGPRVRCVVEGGKDPLLRLPQDGHGVALPHLSVQALETQVGPEGAEGAGAVLRGGVRGPEPGEVVAPEVGVCHLHVLGDAVAGPGHARERAHERAAALGHMEPGQGEGAGRRHLVGVGPGLGRGLLGGGPAALRELMPGAALQQAKRRVFRAGLLRGA
mmetsp:Transcript_41923/g.129842  ORF Transcript_41923/g.129842 Transcript_41923/m.129842 type:complete len:390 (-) Transcript_41923:249-1418(-)